MANFYLDNEDIQFLFRHYPLTKLVQLMEDDFSASKKYPWAPADENDGVLGYENLLEIVGHVSGDYIDPRAGEVDLEGNHLNPDGTVTYAKGTAENLKNLAEAQVMGFTLPHRFGGLNCPSLLYTMSNEIVSRADAALMNIYGLQGIAETINAFACEEIKQQYLPGFAEGKLTGAMVLTEPDAGSDLQSVKLRAYQDDKGQWRLNGVKRFITNGCGEVLLVLARSEPDRSGGLGLSLFVCDRGPTVKVRRLENKLGIHGSPTCELIFKDTPCQLIGERQRGLVTYVMSLMNGARVGIAAQSIGLGEAAFRVARDYAASRVQFGQPIENFPAVRDLLIEMKIDLEASRSLTYETCWHVDHENHVLRKLELEGNLSKDMQRDYKQQEKRLKRLTAMLTPMSKYLASEMCNRVAYDSIQVLGGSGYMKDYPLERYARDARITTIYEGTSQLQVVAAVRGVCNGTLEKYLMELEEFAYPAECKELVDILVKGREQIVAAVKFVKEHPGVEYMDLYGRKLVDVGIMLICGHLFLRQSVAEPKWNDKFTQTPTSDNGPVGVSPYEKVKQHKKVIARRYITMNAPKIIMLCDLILSDDRSSMTEYLDFVGALE